ncbi:UDP-N-acetylmuramoyl-L-alanyl-D-glutamate--2,6-diaminopimelate ligase [Taibaiella koreensis]|uniref:UDP-N-acetylmuramoyl-L-alanyl-D-glutamate--2, 6-diaminopimelate ligase n=1 Tax=Taibaiella koreensis TaxID=1268548 RepID=UPI000E59E89B|nr:UDP-N-acetylmuramoyl-L-alanyl-D-glutamate--2,6-diaminopimelate ligase [Taibaiella koreensis]
MKSLKEIVEGIKVLQVAGNSDVQVQSLTLDSRKAGEGTLFFAQKGTLTDGHQYIDQVIAAGAIAIICEVLPATLSPAVTYVQVTHTAAVVGLVAAAFYDVPSAGMTVIGVTGTNGKTTVATLLYKLYTALGYTCGLISTVENHIGGKVVPATHTTPDPVSLQGLFRQMADTGCSHVFMEVSSHAIHQHRIAGIRFDGGIFTNITHDHLDYHATFDEYIRVKKLFFDGLDKHAFALTNADDKRGMVMLQNTKAERKTYSLRVPADFKGKVLENDLDGLQMTINKTDVHFRMSGLFNAYNLLAVYGAAELMGADKMEVLALLSDMKGAPGRFDTYRSVNERLLGIIDYAHTPDALLNVLATIRQFGGQRQLITVVGCGGDRDKTKRPVMAEVACEHSDKVILTSDNPRSEDPEAILNDMESGLSYAQKKKTLRISDRREAIKTACSLAHEEDVILVAGKGHETYQEIKGVRHHFDDKEVLQEMFILLEK